VPDRPPMPSYPGAQRVPSPRQCLRGIRLRQGVFALSLVHGCKTRKRVKSGRMLGARHAPLDLQGLAEERFSLRVLALCAVGIPSTSARSQT
jgi:hypothetical protein